MQMTLTQICEEMQRQAKRCETIAQDKTEEALTGAPHETPKNELEAREWFIKSEVWREAEAVVRGFVSAPTLVAPGLTVPLSVPN